MATMPNLFDRLGKPQPTTKEVVKAEKIQPIEALTEETPAAVGLLEKLEKDRPLLIETEPRKVSPTERLQGWLTKKWRRSAISLRDICVYGPHTDRSRQTNLNLALKLVEQGFLIPIEAHRHDTLKWKIVRKNQRPATPTTDPQPQTAVAT